MFKVGDKVRLIKDTSIWGDTHIAIQNGTLVMKEEYEVAEISNKDDLFKRGNGARLYVPKKDIYWWVGIDCLEHSHNKKDKKPSWL